MIQKDQNHPPFSTLFYHSFDYRSSSSVPNFNLCALLSVPAKKLKLIVLDGLKVSKQSTRVKSITCIIPASQFLPISENKNPPIVLPFQKFHLILYI